MSSIEKRVKRMQRWVLGGIVAVIAVPLVLWGAYVPDEGRADDGDERAGEIDLYHRTVTRREIREAQFKAPSWLRYEALTNATNRSWAMSFVMRPRGWDMLRQFGMVELPDPVEEDHAWELLILLEHARALRLTVSDEEVSNAARALFRESGGDPDAKGPERDAAYESFVHQAFQTPVSVFEAMLRDALLVDKALAYELPGLSVNYAEIYQDILRKSQKVRVLVAGIDPLRFRANPRPIGAEEIRSYFDKHRAEFAEPERFQINILLADLEEFKKRQPEPSEEDLRKYYEDNKDAEFVLYETKEDGQEEPKKIGHKPFEQVRGEIRGKIVESRAREAMGDGVLAVHRRIQTLLAEEERTVRKQVTEELKDKPAEERAKLEQMVSQRVRTATAAWFEGRLVGEFSPLGIPLIQEITALLDLARIQEAYKQMGAPQGAPDELYGFIRSAAPGDIIEQPVETERGWAILRFNERREKYEPDLNEAIRKKIQSLLAEQDIAARAKRFATELQQTIARAEELAATVRSIEAAHGLRFRPTLYFGDQYEEPAPPADLGLVGESGLASQIRHRAFLAGFEPRPGAGFQIEGDSLGLDKKGWIYLCVVEDLVTVLPTNLKERFDTTQDRLEADRRRAARRSQIQIIKERAGFRKAATPAGPPSGRAPQGEAEPSPGEEKGEREMKLVAAGD